MGSGRHGFDLAFGSGLSSLTASLVRVFREADGAELDNSPFLFEPPPAFDDATRQRIAATLATAETEEALAERVIFLAGQANALLQRLAERQGGVLAAQAHRDLLRRWSRRLPDMPDEPPPPGARHALVIDHAMPTPQLDAGSCAVTSHMHSLQRLGYRVSFVAADMGEAHGRELLDAGIVVCGAPFYASVEEVLRRRGGNLDLVYLHRAPVAMRYLPLVRQCCPAARVAYSVADLHHLRLQRQAAAQDLPDLLAASRKVQQDEALTARAADIVITHSSFEAGLLTRMVRAERVHLVPWSVPARPTTVPAAQRQGVAFIGGQDHAPNRDAARWLAEEIMPLVWRQAPLVRCMIVGKSLPTSLPLSDDPRVVALGQVPRLADIFDRARVTVAPLAFGAGLKGKVIESLAAGVPCICTPVAAEGFDLPASLAALVGETAQEVADLIVALHGAPERVDACGADAVAFAALHYSDLEVDRRMARALGLAEPVDPPGIVAKPD